MKKSILTFVLAISCTVFMTACGNGEKATEEKVPETTSEENTALEQDAVLKDSDSEENTAVDDASEQSTQNDATEKKAEEAEEKETKTSASSAPATLSDDLYDFQISIDGTVYQFPMLYSDFEALGWEYDGDNTKTLSSDQYTGAQSWEKDGFTVYTVFGNLSMNTVAFSDSMVSGIRIEKYNFEGCNWEILLPAGIQRGVSSTDDIKAAYGEPTSDFDGSLYYEMTYRYDSYRQIDLYVYKDSGVLEEIRIDNLVEIEGADNSVNAEVPDII